MTNRSTATRDLATSDRAEITADTRTTALVVESMVLRGDISGLSPEERARFYLQMCESLGLSAASQPLAILRLNGKEILYPTRGATDQLAAIHRLNREIIDGPRVIDVAGTKMIYAVCRATHPNGRTETAVATVPVTDPVNALMKCETKAKRRATLSILGLGMLDETEIETIPASVSRAHVETPTIDAAVEPKSSRDAAKEAAATAILADYDADVADGRDPDEAHRAAKTKGREQGCASVLQSKMAMRESEVAAAKRAEAERIAALPPEEHPAVVALVDELASAETPAAVAQVAREHRRPLLAAGESVVSVAWRLTVEAWGRVGGLSGEDGLRAEWKRKPAAAPVAPPVDAIVE